jgi:hypothetical protein
MLRKKRKAPAFLKRKVGANPIKQTFYWAEKQKNLAKYSVYLE